MKPAYLQILEDTLKHRNTKNPAYSLRAFARDLKISVSTLSEILNNKYLPSRNLCLKILQELKLDPITKNSFLLSTLSETDSSNLYKPNSIKLHTTCPHLRLISRRLEDIKTLVKIYRHAVGQRTAKSLSMPLKTIEATMHSLAQIESRWLLTSQENSYNIVAWQKESIVGFGSLDLVRTEIEGIYIDPNHWQKGIGSTILNHLETIAKRHHITEVYCASSLMVTDFFIYKGFQHTDPAAQGFPLQEAGIETQGYLLSKRLKNS